MSHLDFAIQHYTDLKAEMEEHEQKQSIGLQYTKRDKYYWSYLFHEVQEELNLAEYTLKKMLDEQLDEYMHQSQEKPIDNNWNKKIACLLLREHLGLHFSASIKDLFLYVGRSVMCIPEQYKATVINGFAHSLDEWASIDIDALRHGIENIGFRMEERCYHCNELMPDFQGSGHAVCTDCL
jgi:hypothetical protein